MVTPSAFAGWFDGPINRWVIKNEIKDRDGMVKALFVDWHKTLSVSLFWEQLREVTHPRHDYHDRIVACLFRDYEHLLSPWGRGILTVEEIVEAIHRDCGLASDVLLRDLRVSCQSMRFAVQGVPDLIREIRLGGTKVVVATDNMDTFGRWTVPSLHLDEIFDDVLNSCELGVCKADTDARGRSTFFDPFLAKHRLAPNECAVIDDSPFNEPAITCSGMKYLRVSGPEEAARILGGMLP